MRDERRLLFGIRIHHERLDLGDWHMRSLLRIVVIFTFTSATATATATRLRPGIVAIQIVVAAIAAASITLPSKQ